MDFNNISDIKKAGFEGFKTMKDLFIDNSVLPSKKGVYLILNTDATLPAFLIKGTGGFFKGRDPNVSVELLNTSWVDQALVVYIGKAGSENGSATLKSRLNQYFGFGQGKNIGHWGGRFIWQLASSSKLVVCWKQLPDQNPREYEKELIANFIKQFGKRPFANLVN